MPWPGSRGKQKEPQASVPAAAQRPPQTITTFLTVTRAPLLPRFSSVITAAWVRMKTPEENAFSPASLPY